MPVYIVRAGKDGPMKRVQRKGGRNEKTPVPGGDTGAR